MESIISNPEKTTTSGLTYRDAGVDIDAGDALVTSIGPEAARTRRAGADAALGGFGALFDLRAAGFDDPLLIAATDGVGTKLELAQATGQHRGLGIDLVAMCANDVLAQGAMPLFFLDYFATGRLEPGVAAEVVAGIADGCIEAGCALIGGETAEMPGIYGKGGYDLAGFCVGAAERADLEARIKPAAGDIAIGVASNGAHANGFSLIRKVMQKQALAATDPAPFAPGQSLGTALLAPTRIYRAATETAMQSGAVSGIAHITGGGLIENPPRVFDDDLCLELDCSAWPRPPLFAWLQQAGGIETTEMLRVFNCGIGLVIFTRPADAAAVLTGLNQEAEQAWIIGALADRHHDLRVQPVGLEGWA